MNHDDWNWIVYFIGWLGGAAFVVAFLIGMSWWRG